MVGVKEIKRKNYLAAIQCYLQVKKKKKKKKLFFLSYSEIFSFCKQSIKFLTNIFSESLIRFHPNHPQIKKNLASGCKDGIVRMDQQFPVCTWLVW